MGSLCNPKRTKTLTAKQRFLQLNIKLEVVANFIFHWWHRTSNKGRQTGSICPPPQIYWVIFYEHSIDGRQNQGHLAHFPCLLQCPMLGICLHPTSVFFHQICFWQWYFQCVQNIIQMFTDAYKSRPLMQARSVWRIWTASLPVTSFFQVEGHWEGNLS